MEPVQNNSLSHSTSPEAWASISSSLTMKGFVPADRRYDGLPDGVPPLRSVHCVANPSSDGAVFPFSRYPKNLPHGADIRLISIDLARFASSQYLLFYIGSTPTQWGPEFLRAYHTHVCVVDSHNEENVDIARRHFVPITKESNAIFRFDEDRRAHVSTRLAVGGFSYPNTVLVSIVGDFSFAGSIDDDVTVQNGHKIGWTSDKVSCPVTECSFQRESLNHLKRHYKAVHLGLRLEECVECDRTFARRDSLEQHVAEVHRMANRHRCSKCDATFSRKSGLRAHEASVHRKMKPHKCRECNRAFSHGPYLKIHVASVHRKEKLYVCEECNSSFSQKAALTFHVASTHRGERSEQCNECSRYFSNRSNLRSHILSAHRSGSSRSHIAGEYDESKPKSTQLASM